MLPTLTKLTCCPIFHFVHSADWIIDEHATIQHLVSQGYALKLVEEPAPVIRQHLRVLDALLGPVLVPPRDVVLSGLEGDELVADALLDEDGAVVLVDDGLLVLLRSMRVSIRPDKEK